MGPKILNFQSFALYKGKIIPQCSLELDDSKNIYFSRVIFNTFKRNTPPFHIFCEIYQIPFLALNINSEGRCPSSIAVSVACSVSGNNRYHNWLHALNKHADQAIDFSIVYNPSKQ